MDKELLLDKEGSIEGRNVALETELLTRLHKEYVDKYVARIEKLEAVEEFVRDDYYHNVHAVHHIMYIHRVGTKGETRLVSADGNRGYEFLVEFDRHDPEYGIYYGCRGLILGGDQKEEIDKFLNEWNTFLKPEVCAVLNNTFVEMDFSGRFLMTNNANNKTFWPFWIALGEDEDVVKIASLATKLIANVYRRYLNGIESASRDVEKKRLSVITRYTDDAYRNVLKQIDKDCGNEARRNYEVFIKAAVKKKILVRDDRYETCWKFQGLMNIEVAHLIDQLCGEIGLKARNASGKDSIPWKYFTPVFLSSSDEPFESLRKTLSQHNDKADHLNDDHKEYARNLLIKMKIIK
ncbi:MAG: hypothetical protein PUJ46_02020 [Alistipes sp.]|nr:hypothetical protein [Alistipes sp.]